MKFVSDSVFFCGATSRFVYFEKDGQAVFKDHKGNFGTLRKNNYNRVRFSSREELEDWMFKNR